MKKKKKKNKPEAEQPYLKLLNQKNKKSLEEIKKKRNVKKLASKRLISNAFIILWKKQNGFQNFANKVGFNQAFWCLPACHSGSVCVLYSLAISFILRSLGWLNETK